MAIVVVGAVFMDIKGFPEGGYSPTGRNAGRVETVHGGVGRNVAEDIANVELRPIFVSMVDESASGTEVLHRLKQHKVNTDYILKRKNGMGLWLAVFDETGDLAGSISQRPKMDALNELLDEKGDEIFSGADSIVVEIDMDQETIKRILHYAEKYGKKVYAVVSNMMLASQRRDFLQSVDCFICNVEEAGILFVDDFSQMPMETLAQELRERIRKARIPSMVVTLGSKGAVYASMEGECGCCAAEHVPVCDTSGAGDAFFAGASIALTYGRPLSEAVRIGTHLAASVITVSESTCPRFRPEELGLWIPKERGCGESCGSEKI